MPKSHITDAAKMIICMGFADASGIARGSELLNAELISGAAILTFGFAIILILRGIYSSAEPVCADENRLRLNKLMTLAKLNGEQSRNAQTDHKKYEYFFGAFDKASRSSMTAKIT